jgi:outer membrane protein TolC
LQYVGVHATVYTSLVNTYKAMGGGWVIQAQATADETDNPSPEPVH